MTPADGFFWPYLAALGIAALLTYAVAHLRDKLIEARDDRDYWRKIADYWQRVADDAESPPKPPSP